jgi:hypothetical protein
MFEIVFGIPIVVAVVALFGLANAWVLSILWSWFIVPLGVAQIGVAHTYGIFLMLVFFSHLHDGDEMDRKAARKQLLRMVLQPFVALLCGWVAHRVMVG